MRYQIPDTCGEQTMRYPTFQYLRERKHRIITSKLLPSSDNRHDAVTGQEDTELESLPLQVERLSSKSSFKQLQGTTQIYEMICKGVISTKDVAQSEHAVATLVHFLTINDFPELQIKAAQTLRCLICGSENENDHQTELVIEHGGILNLLRLVASSNLKVRNQAVLGLGNVAAKSVKIRDIVLGEGALPQLLSQLSGVDSLMKIDAAWALVTLFCWKPAPPFDEITRAIPAALQLVHASYPELVQYGCDCLVFMMMTSADDDNRCDILEAFMESGVIESLERPLRNGIYTSNIAALIVLENIAALNSLYAQVVVDKGLLLCLPKLLRCTDRMVKINVCQVISTFSLGNERIIEGLMKAGVIAGLVELLDKGARYLKWEAASALSNATRNGSVHHIMYLVGLNYISPLCNLLSWPADPMIVSRILKGLRRTCLKGKNGFVIMDGPLRNLRHLLEHDTDKMVKKEACSLVFCLTAGRLEQREAVIRAGFIPALVTLLQSSEDFDKTDAGRAIQMVTKFASSATEIKCLVDVGCVKPLCDLLESVDTKIVYESLLAIENLLRQGDLPHQLLGNPENDNEFLDSIITVGGVQKMEVLADHNSFKISSKAIRILDAHFEVWEEAEPVDG